MGVKLDIQLNPGTFRKQKGWRTQPHPHTWDAEAMTQRSLVANTVTRL